MTTPFLHAIAQLTAVQVNQALSPVERGHQRGVAIGQALLALAAEHGVALEQPLSIDSRGEFRIFVEAPTGPGQPVATEQRYGLKFASLLNKHNPRCGTTGGAHLLASSSWCYLNHFDAERLVVAAVSPTATP
ncbi:MAG: hypothetical protein Q7S87_10155 [Agitococcus sp.]|nr:hypothetical protein [Agitococcus sp.]MDO9179310.1 hypothetical protein [Agitococcus sp.]